jgi:hypothetical protein
MASIIVRCMLNETELPWPREAFPQSWNWESNGGGTIETSRYNLAVEYIGPLSYINEAFGYLISYYEDCESRGLIANYSMICSEQPDAQTAEAPGEAGTA